MFITKLDWILIALSFMFACGWFAGVALVVKGRTDSYSATPALIAVALFILAVLL